MLLTPRCSLCDTLAQSSNYAAVTTLVSYGRDARDLRVSSISLRTVQITVGYVDSTQ